MNRSFHTAAWRALVASSLLATAAMGHAQSAAPAPVPAVAPVATATAAASMGFQQLVERVTALGYSDVREIERKSDKLYEVKARNAQGQRVELYVDARSGEVLREEVKR